MKETISTPLASGAESSSVVLESGLTAKEEREVLDCLVLEAEIMELAKTVGDTSVPVDNSSRHRVELLAEELSKKLDEMTTAQRSLFSVKLAASIHQEKADYQV